MAPSVVPAMVPAMAPAVNQPIAPAFLAPFAPAVDQPVAPNVIPAILPKVPVMVPVIRTGKRVRRVKSVGITISRDVPAMVPMMVPAVRSQRRAISVGAIMVCRQSTRIKRQTKPFNIGIITCIVCQKTFRENIHGGRTVCSLKCSLAKQRR